MSRRGVFQAEQTNPALQHVLLPSGAIKFLRHCPEILAHPQGAGVDPEAGQPGVLLHWGGRRGEAGPAGRAPEAPHAVRRQPPDVRPGHRLPGGHAHQGARHLPQGAGTPCHLGGESSCQPVPFKGEAISLASMNLGLPCSCPPKGRVTIRGERMTLPCGQEPFPSCRQ